jgi:hypothetical protein
LSQEQRDKKRERDRLYQRQRYNKRKQLLAEAEEARELKKAEKAQKDKRERNRLAVQKHREKVSDTLDLYNYILMWYCCISFCVTNLS